MPLYEYKCRQCGDTFEKLQKFSDATLTVCECGKNGEVVRVISPPAFHLKGGGWYKDGYGSGGSKKDSTTASSDSSTKPASSETKSETKTETKTESKPASTTPSSDSK